ADFLRSTRLERMRIPRVHTSSCEEPALPHRTRSLRIDTYRVSGTIPGRHMLPIASDGETPRLGLRVRHPRGRVSERPRARYARKQKPTNIVVRGSPKACNSRPAE